jgi:DNA-binding CsgD family transcriptional regulator
MVEGPAPPFSCPTCGAPGECEHRVRFDPDAAERSRRRHEEEDHLDRLAAIRQAWASAKARKKSAKRPPPVTSAPLPGDGGPIWEAVSFPGQRRDPDSVLPRLRTAREVELVTRRLEDRRILALKRKGGRKGYAMNRTAKSEKNANERRIPKAKRDGLSQREAAALFGISRTTVQKYWHFKQ